MRVSIREMIVAFRQPSDNRKGRPRGSRNSFDSDAFTGTFPRLRMHLTELDIFRSAPNSTNEEFGMYRGRMSKRKPKMD